MRLKHWFGSDSVFPGVLIVGTVLAGLCFAAIPAFARQGSDASQQQSGDPVADAARRAREQKKNEPKPKRVYTDDDVKPANHAAETSASSGSASGAQGTATGQAATTGKGTEAAPGKGGEKDDPATVWKKRFADQRGKISTAEKELDVLQRELQKAQVQYYPDPQKALTEQYSRQDVNDIQTKIDQKKQEIANLKQQLSDMEDELRKSGGDVGWARQ